MTQGQAGGFTIEESARRLGHYRWAAMRLFELLGSWTADVGDHDLAIRWAANSRHHGWHAELLGERLPTVRDLAPDRQTVPPNAQFEAIFSTLAEVAGPDATPARLVGVYGVVVPHLIAAQSWHLERCTPVADTSVARTLGFVLADHTADWRDAQVDLQRRVAAEGRDAEGWRRARDIRLVLEDLLAESGGISGPSTWVEQR